MPIRWCVVSAPQPIGVGLVVGGDPQPGRRPEQVGGAEAATPVRAGLGRAAWFIVDSPGLGTAARPAGSPQPSGLF